jgi:UDP-2-acetamido-3-amino-2,3-dideoxy-glucuronate N-acetyltransferase
MVFDERMGSLESAAIAGAAPKMVKLASITETRGRLIAAEGEALPFTPVRYFLIHDVPPEAVRAQHAQRRNEELISCPVGACTVELRWRGGGHAAHRLTDPETALHVPPWVWVECREFTDDAVLLVLCSRPHDPGDHITDFAEFEAGPPDLP